MNFSFSKKSVRTNISATVFTFACAAILIGISFLGKPTTTEAQVSCLVGSGGVDTAVAGALAVPVFDQGTNANTAFTKQKGCLLDSLAQAAAKVVLQEMTADIVNWINSGFQGNSAFLTNPEGFFMDVNDQITGAFIANSGALSALCSPFNLDIRLSIAMMASKPRTRYTCTLGTIINDYRNNPPRISVGVDQTANGATLEDFRNGNVLRDSNQLSINGQSADAVGKRFATMEGFVSGDFAQGGWPVFMAMTSNQQNNAMGAWLAARSDLQAQIAAKENSINNDLNRGDGFLSWSRCTDGQTFAPGTGQALGEPPPPGVKVKENQDGGVTYQNCRTETPGSFITASLNKQTGSSVDQIVNINDINDAINEIAQALLFKTLQTGLSTLSESDGGTDGLSYVDRMAQDIDTDQKRNIRSLINNSTSDAQAEVNAYVALRTRIVDLVKASKVEHETVLACVRVVDTEAADKMQRTINREINPALAKHQERLDKATSTLAAKLTALVGLQARINAATTTVESSKIARVYADLVPPEGFVTPTLGRQAANDLEDVQALTSTWHSEAVQSKALCTPVTTTP